MKFTKEHWFYVTEIDGEEFIVQKKSEDSKVWECTHSNYIYKGKTRKEAVLKAKNEER